MRFFFIGLCSLILAACSSHTNQATLYPYLDKTSQPSKQVMIATINYGLPSRNYLVAHEAFIDEEIRNYLKKQGVQVVSSKIFAQQWHNATQRYGHLYNALSGEKTHFFAQALDDTLTTIFQQHPQLEAILFTDLIETPLLYEQASKRHAQWHGVQRRIKIEGIGEGVSTNFNWSEQVTGISLLSTLINRDKEVIFQSAGGIQVAEALVLSNSHASFQRRQDLLLNKKEIAEGIALSLHPWITMRKYPQ